MAVIYFLAIGLMIALLIMVAVRVFEGWRTVRDRKSHLPPEGGEGHDDRKDRKRSDHEI